jgi:hypothetical protein
MATSRRVRRPKSERPPRKPMRMTRRVSLFEREVSVRLAPVALELLHGAARTLTEGDLDGDSYAGSTMLTIDLARTADRVSDPIDASTAQRVAVLYDADDRARDHARRIAVKEARRIAGVDLVQSTIDLETRARGHEVHLSLNIEAHRERRQAVEPAPPPPPPVITPAVPAVKPAIKQSKSAELAQLTKRLTQRLADRRQENR